MTKITGQEGSAMGFVRGSRRWRMTREIAAFAGGSFVASIILNLTSAWLAHHRPVDDKPRKFSMSRLVKFDEAEDVAILLHDDGRREEITAVELRERYSLKDGWGFVKVSGVPVGRTEK